MHRQHADLQVGTKGVGHVVLLEGDRSMNNNAPTSKVFYRPIEASIRWAGLLRFEHVILASISSPRDLPQSLDCPRWGELRLYTDRIYDGILNGELPFGQNGITMRDIELIDSPDINVSHFDLKRWMSQRTEERRVGKR